jgi:hypothetical protein
MKRRASRELFDYWNAVRRGRLAPTGAGFDPSAVREAMREGFYLDMAGEGFGRFTWVGSDLRLGLPDARRDGLFIDVWSRDVAAEATRLLRLARRPCPVIAGAWGTDRTGATRVVEALVLPLLADPRAPESARLIGVFAGVDPSAPLDRLDGVSSFRILDDSPTPWREPGFPRRRLRDGWSANHAELERRAQAELGARLAAGAEPATGAPRAGEEVTRVARHLTIIEGGRIAEKAPT